MVFVIVEQVSSVVAMDIELVGVRDNCCGGGEDQYGVTKVVDQ